MPFELSELLFTMFRSGMRVDGVDDVILYLDSQCKLSLRWLPMVSRLPLGVYWAYNPVTPDLCVVSVRQ